MPDKKIKKYICDIELEKIEFYLKYGIIQSEKNSLIQQIKSIIESSNTNNRIQIIHNLSRLRYTPKEILLDIAKESEVLACQIITHYAHLSEEELTSIIKLYPSNYTLIALAKRKKINTEICQYIIENGEIDAALTLLKHHSKDIDIENISRIINKFPHEPYLSNIIKLLPTENYDMMRQIYLYLDKNIKTAIGRKLDLKITHKNILSKLNILKLNELNIMKNSFEFEIRFEIDALYNDNLLSIERVITFLTQGNLYGFIYSIYKITEIPMINVKKTLIDMPSHEEAIEIFEAHNISHTLIHELLLCLDFIKNGLRNKSLKESNYKKELCKFLKSSGCTKIKSM